MDKPKINMANTCSPSRHIQAKIDEWIRWDKNAHTSGIIRKLASEMNFDELSRILLHRITFGTAGLRGKMSAGYACMNDLVIVQTGQGLLKFLENNRIELLRRNGVIIGYDGRHNSQKWARMTASIFLHAGYKVRIGSDVCPTPFIPFGVRVYNLCCGIMITASHNPKDDNGYKVYDYNACQIIPPVDKQIQNYIMENLEPLESSWDTAINSSPLVMDHLQETMHRYMEKVISERIYPPIVENNASVEVKFAYTAMHGVGWAAVEQAANIVKGIVDPVPEQRDPHADFPTVKFPNPEEGKSSLDLAMKFANKKGYSIILANDPDADRFAVAEKDKNTGEWRIFNGNELGALFGWWMLECHKKYETVSLGNVYMVSSTVSSKILKTMAEAEGFNFLDTLTGFKWIGTSASELEAEGFFVLFCFEEAIGFMCNDYIFDKDGVSALAQFIGLANHVYGKGKQLHEQLDNIYDIYGLHLSLNSYYLCYKPIVIKRVFERVRNFKGANTYPTGILNNKYKVISVRDLTTGYDDSQPDNRAMLPISSESEMISFVFDNGLHFTLRTSGTEPKIKYYSELCMNPEIKDKATGLVILQEMVTAICREFLEPDKNRLIPRSTQ
ncbi:phosphopentomutase-like isoform X2 [Anthonomus grandis grandis]|uniref:phosphopentomutase-like isoform X2 n=1 Tax=Anthonomus grandis grandis TaxID=2921223 RepID=UPI0021653627|nr:phosphopentomutase-like isoform X2 [Anthonomus grandis grandis]